MHLVLPGSFRHISAVHRKSVANVPRNPIYAAIQWRKRPQPEIPVLHILPASCIYPLFYPVPEKHLNMKPVNRTSIKA